MSVKLAFESRVAAGTATLIVVPSRCLGLDDYREHPSLRLDFNYAFRPDMAIEATDQGLRCLASFAGRSRRLYIPWHAVLAVSSPDEIARQRAAAEGRKRARAAEAAPTKPADGGELIRVDFRNKKKIP